MTNYQDLKLSREKENRINCGMNSGDKYKKKEEDQRFTDYASYRHTLSYNLDSFIKNEHNSIFVKN